MPRHKGKTDLRRRKDACADEVQLAVAGDLRLDGGDCEACRQRQRADGGVVGLRPAVEPPFAVQRKAAVRGGGERDKARQTCGGERSFRCNHAAAMRQRYLR